MSHTPGPWKVDCIADDFDGAIDIVSDFTFDAEGRKTANWIASCDLQDDRIEENHANASLIAAAPDLLAALKDMLSQSGDTNATTGEFDTAAGRAYRAVAKAEGR